MTPTEREAQAIHLAHVTARRMHRGDLSHVLREDVEGAALLGAAKALHQWRPGRGTEFRSYAIKLIQCEIHEEMRRWDWLKREERTEAKREHQATGEWPAWSWEPESLEALREVDGEALLDHLPDPNVDVEAEALVAVEGGVEAPVDESEWRRLVERLTPLAREVLVMHYWDEMPLTSISRALGKRWDAAKAAERRALLRLRAWAEAAGLSG